MKSLIKIFKHIFIPHVNNNYKPHFFREISVFSILAIVLVLFSVSLGSKIYIRNNNLTAEVLPAVLVDLANRDRLENGEISLKRNPLLDEAAKLKAEDMAASGYFAHTSPAGLTPWHWFNKVGYYFTYAGENLAIDFTESVDVENAWLNSPKHKENIMSNNFTEIGIATVEGYYNGSPTTYVVEMFGRPVYIAKAEASTELKPVDTPEPKLDEKEPVKPATPTEPTIVPEVSPELAVAVEEVKGESTEVVQDEQLETIKENTNFIIVKNTTVNEEVALQTPTEQKTIPKYSTWSERLVFLLPSYTDKLYRIFFWIVLASLMMMTIIEIRKQHAKNITYGILLVVIIFCFIYINQAMFITSLLA